MAERDTSVHGEPEGAPSLTDDQAVERLNEAYRKITGELSKVIVGQKRVIEELLIGMFAGGHCLLQGVPGLAKTLMVRTLADTLNLSFNRIQFTPDLMPADITGTDVIQEDRTTGVREFRFIGGPVFANVVLADEINRTPPKTQAALLEAMQEHQVTAGGKRHRLPDPFFVLATQNPIEQEGTYPLPEAQLDRFMFEILVDYPSEEEEFDLVRKTTSAAAPAVEKALSHAEVAQLQEVVRRVPVADHVIRYAMQLARLTRRQQGTSPTSSAIMFRGERSAGEPVPRPGGQGAGHASRAGLRQYRGRAGSGGPRAQAPHHYQLQRRGRRGLARRHRPPADGAGCVRFCKVIEGWGIQGWTITGSISTRRRWRNSPGLTSRRGSSSRGTSPGCTKARIPASRSSSPSTASTPRATMCATSTGKSSAKPTAITSSGLRKKPTLPARSWSTPASRWPTARRGAAVSKLEYAQYVAAALAHIVIRQQDAVGLATFNTSVTRFLGPSSQAAHLKQLVHVMEHTAPGGETALGPIFHDLAERIRKRGLVIILSDLFDDIGTLLSGLRHFRHRRHDVSVMQVIDPAEQDFPFEDLTRFRGLEGLPEQTVEPRALRRAYQTEFESFLRQVRGICSELQMDYVLLRTDRPLDVALRAFLTRRMQARGERDRGRHSFALAPFGRAGRVRLRLCQSVAVVGIGVGGGPHSDSSLAPADVPRDELGRHAVSARGGAKELAADAVGAARALGCADAAVAFRGPRLCRAARAGRRSAKPRTDAAAAGHRDRRLVQHGDEGRRRDAVRAGQNNGPANRLRLAARGCLQPAPHCRALGAECRSRAGVRGGFGPR